MTKFLFDLDGTITKQETLPIIAQNYGVEAEIAKLTAATVSGHVPFIESFIRRVFLLGKLPVDEINELLENVALYTEVLSFIQNNINDCFIVTGNLSCWVEKLSKRVGCGCYCSEGIVEDNQVKKISSILKKEDIVKKMQSEGHQVVFIGDGNNDVEAMREADVSIASGLTHSPAMGAISVADYLVLNEVALCRQLNQLL